MTVANDAATLPERFKEFLSAGYEMEAAARAGYGDKFGEALNRIHVAGENFSPQEMQVVAGALMGMWAHYVAEDTTILHPDELIDKSVGIISLMLEGLE